MGELAKQLSSYNLLNYLLTGVAFVVLAKAFTTFSFVQNDLAVGVFVYYLIGMIVSRVGSLVVEPTLQAIKIKGKKFIVFAPYEDFVVASSKNAKLEILSEENNVYRSVLAAILCVLLLRLVQAIEQWWPSATAANPWVLLAALLVLFVFAYWKQVGYIRKRVEAIVKTSKTSEEY
jgi:hypothetical protein